MHTATWILGSLALLSAHSYGDSFSFLSRRKKLAEDEGEEAPQRAAESDGGASLIELGEADEGDAVIPSSSDSGDGQEAVNLMQEVQDTKPEKVKQEDDGQTGQPKLEEGAAEPAKTEPEMELASSVMESAVEKEAPKAEEQSSETHSTGFIEQEKTEPTADPAPKPAVPEATTEVPSAITELESKETDIAASSTVKLESSADAAGEVVPETVHAEAVGDTKSVVSSEASVEPEAKQTDVAAPSVNADMNGEPQAVGTATSSEVKLEAPSSDIPQLDPAANPPSPVGSGDIEAMVSDSTQWPASTSQVKGAAETQADSTGTVMLETSGSSEVKPESTAAQTEHEVSSEVKPEHEVSSEVKPEATATETKPEVSSEVKPETAETGADSTGTVLLETPGSSEVKPETAETHADSIGTVLLETPGSSEVKPETSAAETKSEVSSEVKPETSAAETKSEVSSEVKPETAETGADSTGTVLLETPGSSEVKPETSAAETKSEVSSEVKPETSAAETEHEVSSEVKPETPAAETKPEVSSEDKASDAGVGFEGTEEVPSRFQISDPTTFKDIGKKKKGAAVNLHRIMM